MPNGITQISRPLEHLCLHSDVSGRAAISLHACACVRACEDACVRAFARGGHVRHNPLAANITSVDGALVPMQAQKCAQASTGLRAPIQLHMKDGKREMPLRQGGWAKKGKTRIARCHGSGIGSAPVYRCHGIMQSLQYMLIYMQSRQVARCARVADLQCQE
jgi:hypothetical protein